MSVEHQSEVRNFWGRKHARILDNPLREVHRLVPVLSANHITVAGGLASVTGVHLMESQHRAGKYNPKVTILAVGFIGLGILFDGIDGPFSRVVRDEMTDEKEKEKNRLFGQWLDPAADAFKEAFLRLETIYTSLRRGHPLVGLTASLGLATDSLPRWNKARAGEVGKKVPEFYNDWRAFGTSGGRIINYAAVLTANPAIRTSIHALTAVANIAVEQERFNIFKDKKINPALSKSDIDDAKYRVSKLEFQCAFNMGMGLMSVGVFVWRLGRQVHKRNGKFF